MSFEGPLDDRLALHELVAIYGDAISRHSVEDLVGIWAEDAVWEHPQVGRYVGAAAIVEGLAVAMAQYPLLVFTSVLGALRLEGARASGRNYTSELVTDSAGNTYRVLGRYDDTYIRHDGRWRFQTRRFNVLHAG